MAMSKDQDSKIGYWLARFSVHCPICNGIDFTWSKDFFQQSKFMDTAGTISPDDTLFVGYTCKKCGHFFMVEAGIAGVPTTK